MLDPRRDIDAALLAYRRLFGFLGLFSGVINLLMLVPSLYMMQVYDRVLTSRNEMTLVMLTVIVLGLFAISSLLEWVRGEVMVKMSAGIDWRLGERVFSAAFGRSLRERSTNPAQVLGDLNTLRQFATGPGLLAFFDVPWLPIYLLAGFLFHPWLGVFMLVGIGILVGLAIWNELATRPGMAEANQASLAAGAYLNGALRNAEAIQAMGMLPALQLRWAVLQRRMIQGQTDASAQGARIQAVTRWVRTTWQALSLGLGALLVLEHEISGGVMIAVSMLLGRAMQPVEQAIASWRQLGNALQSHERLTRLLEDFPRAPERMALPAPTGNLRTEDLGVVPPGATQPVLTHLSVALSRGEVLAVVGPSGSGKSSLARALVGVWPASQGAVRLDGADIAEWSRDALGPHIGYLPQDIELFDGSVAENIARFGALDSPRVIEAARLAGIHELVLSLAKGYDTPIGQAGHVLSSGQRQRVALARALYGRPALVVLDEPDAHLDGTGEAALVRAIASLKATGCTVVMITHRPGVLGVVDKILMLRQGALQRFGPRDEVLAALGAPAPTAVAAPSTPPAATAAPATAAAPAAQAVA